jgi:hypothetical protein
MEDIFRNLGLGLALLVQIILVIPFLLLALAIPYAVLHSRDSRSLERDPQLGIKTALYFFYSVCILLVLTGLTVIVVDMVQDQQWGAPAGGFARPPRSGEWFNTAKRNGTALIFAGLTFGLLQFVLIHMATNDRRWPLVRRVFTGWRMAISGLVVLTTFTLLVVNLFEVNVQIDSLKNFLAILCVWGPAWLVDLILLRYRSYRFALDEERLQERLHHRERPE